MATSLSSSTAETSRMRRIARIVCRVFARTSHIHGFGERGHQRGSARQSRNRTAPERHVEAVRLRDLTTEAQRCTEVHRERQRRRTLKKNDVLLSILFYLLFSVNLCESLCLCGRGPPAKPLTLNRAQYRVAHRTWNRPSRPTTRASSASLARCAAIWISAAPSRRGSRSG